MTQLWQFTVTAELDDEGEVVVTYDIVDTVSVAELIGHLEVIKSGLISGALEGEDETEHED